MVHEVSMKHAEEKSNLVSLSVRVEEETAEKLREIADAEFRPVAAELRRLIEGHIRNYAASSRARDRTEAK